MLSRCQTQWSVANWNATARRRRADVRFPGVEVLKDGCEVADPGDPDAAETRCPHRRAVVGLGIAANCLDKNLIGKALCSRDA